MDAAETPAERQARQFAQLRRVGKLAMVLAEAAGTAALAEFNPPRKAGPPAPSPANPAQIFANAARTVRQVITLELRVEAGADARQSAYRAPAPKLLPPPTPPLTPDPRRVLLKQVLHDAVRNDPNRARRCREIDDNIEQELLAHPAGTEIIAETLGTICQRLNIAIEPVRLTDEFLDFDEPIKALSRPKFRENSS